MRSSRSRVALQVVVLAAVVAAVWYVASTYGGKHHLFDLRIYRAAVRYWLGGHNLYDYSQPDPINVSLGFTYPPFAALTMVPMAYLPWGVVEWVSNTATLLCALVTSYWVVAPTARRRGWPVWFATGIVTALAFGLEPIRETMSFGQVNLLLVLLILGDVLVLGRRGSKLTGVGIGLATAVKLTPGIFIVYLLVTRRWRAAATAAATAAGASVVAAAVDWHASWRFWTDTLWATGRLGFPDNAGNQAINGVLARLYDPRPPSGAVWLVLALTVGGYGLWRAARAYAARDELTGLTLTGLTGVLISPVSWTHHIYWIVPALVILVDAALDARRGRRWWYAGLATAVYAAFAFSVVWIFERKPGHHWDNSVPEMVGENGYALLCLVLLVALPVRRGVDDRRHPEVGAPERATATV